MSSKVDVTPATQAVPIPPRYWWLKRILITAGIVFVGLVCLRLWWGHVAHQRLQAEIDRIRAAGEPIFPEDFDRDPVPDKDNAAIFLQKAANAITDPDDVELTINDVLRDPQLCVTRANDVAKLIEANEAALSLLHEARSATGADWGLRPRSPLINSFPWTISGQRQLAKLLRVVASYHHQNGNHAACVAAIRDALSASDALTGMTGGLIPFFTASATSALAIDSIETLTPTLMISNRKRDQRSTVAPAERQQIQGLIAELRDESAMRRSLIRGLKFERASQLDASWLMGRGNVNFMAVGTAPGAGATSPFSRLAAFPFKPMIELSALRMMRYTTGVISAVQEPNWQLASGNMPAPATRGLRALGDVLSSMIMPPLERSVQIYFRGLAERRMAPVALAIRLYQIDFGRRPETLNELVPDYLPGIPSDPFATDGRTIGYLRDAPRPILYSVGSDGIDDQGLYRLRKGGSVDWDAKDLPFFLNGDRPRRKPLPSQPPPTSTETDDDDGNVQNGERNPDQDQAADENP